MTQVTCPRARSDMTPCVLRDGDLARDVDGVCVGCGQVLERRCCEGPHIRPCGPTGDTMFCACGCSGADERCWLEPEGPSAARHEPGCKCVYCEHNRDARCSCQPCVWIRVEFGEMLAGTRQLVEPEMPCCDYRDHGSGCCACPDHPRSELHPFGATT